MHRLCLLAALAALALRAQTHPIQELVEAARVKSPEFQALLAKRAPNLKTQGGAWVWGQDFLFAAEAQNAAAVSVDGQPSAALERLPDSNIFYRVFKMRTGVTHSYQFSADGKPLGARRDLPGYNPDS